MGAFKTRITEVRHLDWMGDIEINPFRRFEEFWEFERGDAVGIVETTYRGEDCTLVYWFDDAFGYGPEEGDEAFEEAREAILAGKHIRGPAWPAAIDEDDRFLMLRQCQPRDAFRVNISAEQSTDFGRKNPTPDDMKKFFESQPGFIFTTNAAAFFETDADAVLFKLRWL